MPHVLIQYRIKPDLVGEHEAAVRKFLGAVRKDKDPNAKYESFRLPDGVSYAHQAWFADEESVKKFQSTKHFEEFAEGLDKRCEDGPTATFLTPIASSEQAD